MTKRTYEEKLSYETNKLLGNGGEQNRFFANAINRQNTAYDVGYAKRNIEFACDVLQTVNFCKNHLCTECKLERAHKNAKKEIFAGKRKVYEKVKDSKTIQIEGEYLVKTSVDPKTGVVTTIMRKIKD